MSVLENRHPVRERSRTLLILALLASILALPALPAGASDAVAPDVADTLRRLEPAERINARIELEPGSAFPADRLDELEVAAGLWNSGRYDESLLALEALGVAGRQVAVGFSWREPLATGTTRLDAVQIGPRLNVSNPFLDFHPGNGNLFVVMESQDATNYQWTLNLSTDNGATWAETWAWDFTTPIRDIGMAVLEDYVYVATTSDFAPAQSRMRRFSTVDGSYDLTYQWHTVVIGGADVQEVEVVSNGADPAYNNRLYHLAILADNTMVFHATDEDGGVGTIPWTEHATGVTDALTSLDACWNERFGSRYLFATYVGTDNGIYNWSTTGASPVGTRIDVNGDSWIGGPVRIAVYDGMVMIVYVYSPVMGDYGIRYFLSHDDGATWSWGHAAVAEADDQGVPDVTGRDGYGFTVVWGQEAGAFDPVWMRHRAYQYPAWNSAEAFNDIDINSAVPLRVERLPTGGYAALTATTLGMFFERLPMLFKQGFEFGDTHPWDATVP